MLGQGTWQVAGALSPCGSLQYSLRDTPLAQRLKSFAPLTRCFARGSRAGGCQRLPKVAPGPEPGRVGASRDLANLAWDSPTARSGQPGCALTAGTLRFSSSYCESSLVFADVTEHR